MAAAPGLDESETARGVPSDRMLRPALRYAIIVRVCPAAAIDVDHAWLDPLEQARPRVARSGARVRLGSGALRGSLKRMAYDKSPFVGVARTSNPLSGRRAWPGG
jgi:hypothetical protein